MFEKQILCDLVTVLYLCGGGYRSSDAVFGFEGSLVVNVKLVADVKRPRM